MNFNPWNLHIGNNENFRYNLLKFSKRNIPKVNEAWADPFLISLKIMNMFFLKTTILKKNKGKISYGKIKDNKILKVSDALDLNYHLSYPFLWRQKNNFFDASPLRKKKGSNMDIERISKKMVSL